MALGKLIYKYWFEPTLPLRYHLHHFGLAGWLKYRGGERAMKSAAAVSAPIRLKPQGSDIVFCFLTGEQYWHQTIYAIKSLHLQLSHPFGVRIFSDGSLNDQHIKKLRIFAPGIEIIPSDKVTEQLNKALPASKFPTLRFLRDWHPFFRRMIDIHCNEGFSMHLDSDMLFFREPEAIINAFKKQRAIFMQDVMDKSYFVDTEANLMSKYNMSCLPYVNGGIIAYDNNLVDYDDLEQKAKLLVDNYLSAGPARIEQTLMSYLLYKQGAIGLDQRQYAIYYDSKINADGNEVVRHYIFKAKLFYFTKEWMTIGR